MNDTSVRPEIITFYSYKGGTGRSMALANVAWILASNRKRVLLIDWDLEAPGLQRYFHPFLSDKSLKASEGLIDFVVDFAYEAVTREPRSEPDWYVPYANILRYARSLNAQFPAPGTIDFIPAGRQGPDYAARVNSFNWDNFYKHLGGGIFLEAAKKSMAGYDYVLIDSRTGVSDTSGICTVQMPDRLVVCFTLNSQSIEGAAAVAESAHRQRQKPDGTAGLKIFPVPMRVELSEKDKLELANELARERFDPLLWHLPREKRDAYWNSVRLLYQPFYAYEEVLAAFGDNPSSEAVVLRSMEALTGYVTDNHVRQFPPLRDAERLEILSQFLRKPKPKAMPAARSGTGAGSWVFFLSYDHSSADPAVRRFAQDLNTEVRVRLGLSPGEPVGFIDMDEINVGMRWEDEVGRALRTSRVLVSLVSPAYVKNPYCGKEFSVFEQRARMSLQRGSDPLAVLPVIWIPLRGAAPPALAKYQWSDSHDPQQYLDHGLRKLLQLRRYEDVYRELISEIADRIVEIHHSGPLPVLDNLQPLDEVPNAFEAQPAGSPIARRGPQHVEFVITVADATEMREFRHDVSSYGKDEWSWRPFQPPIGYDLGIVLQQMAIEAHVHLSVARAGPDLWDRLDAADRSNSVVVLIIDAWALAIPKYQALLEEIDRTSSLNTAILIVWNDEDAETKEHLSALQLLVRETFRHRQVSRDAYFRGDIRTVQQFREQVFDAIAAIRAAILERAEVLRSISDPGAPLPTISRIPRS